MNVYCLYKILAVPADNPLNDVFNHSISVVFNNQLPNNIVCAMRNNLSIFFGAYKVVDASIKREIIHAYISTIKSYINDQTEAKDWNTTLIAFTNLDI